MPSDLILTIVAVFISVGLLSFFMVSRVLSRTAPERRFLQKASMTGIVNVDAMRLAEAPSELAKRFQHVVPKSPKELGRLRRRLSTAGYRSASAAVIFGFSEIAMTILGGLLPLLTFGGSRGIIFGILGAMIGYLLPTFWLARQTAKRQKQITNGLPDALDLLVVCIEAGSGLDQAIVKTSDELDISYPALAEELRLISTEIRAGKPRIEAFKNFAARTKVDDVRALVVMLVQTDRFGTSIAQALRTHAETARIKRRQRAEERAAKVAVKLVFPLVFLLFPALYVAILGPAVVQVRPRVQGRGHEVEGGPDGQRDDDSAFGGRRDPGALLAASPIPAKQRGRLDHTMTACRRLSAVLLLGCLAAGCASHRKPDTLAHRFVRTGQPKIQLGDAVRVKGSLHEYAQKLRHLTAAAKPQTKSLLPTIETRDPDLSRALMAELILPTAQNHCHVAEQYYRLHILDTAYQRFNRALRVNPTYAPAFEGMARVWRDWGEPGLALGDAHRATYYAPDWAQGWNTLGTVLQAVDRRADARNAYHTAVARDPKAAYAYNNLCYLSVLEGKASRGVAECQAALRLDPTLIATRNNLALAYASTGRIKLAEQVLLEGRDSAVGQYNVGMVRMAQGRYSAAADAFNQARTLKPRWRAAHDRAKQARTLASQTSDRQEPSDVYD